MKKKSFIFMAVTIVAIALVFAACPTESKSNSTSTPSGPVPAALRGTWTQTQGGNVKTCIFDDASFKITNPEDNDTITGTVTAATALNKGVPDGFTKGYTLACKDFGATNGVISETRDDGVSLSVYLSSDNKRLVLKILDFNTPEWDWGEFAKQ